MGHYLIEVTHTPEQCLADLDTVLEHSPGLLQKLEWGCRTGVHTGWAVVEAVDAADANRQIPAAMRSRTRVVGIQRFTPDEIRALHVK